MATQHNRQTWIKVDEHGHAYKLEGDTLMCTPLQADDTPDPECWTVVEQMPWNTHDALADIAEALGADDGDAVVRSISFYHEVR